MGEADNQKLSLLVIFTSFLVASMLNVYPLSASVAPFRPMFIIMVLIYWLLFQPTKVGLFSAFFLGILSDLLLDTRLGQQAFCAVLVALTIRISSIYVKQMTPTNTWFIASLSLLIFQLTLWGVQYITQNIFVPEAIIALGMSIAIWPLVSFALKTPNRHIR